MTSIVKDKANHYFIAKKVPINDEKTMHEVRNKRTQIQMMKGLAHPNIIALHEIIEEEKWAYIIEEYCEEGDLQYFLKRQSKLKKLIQEEVVARWLLQILLAIEYLHHLKIIHRYSISNSGISGPKISS